MPDALRVDFDSLQEQRQLLTGLSRDLDTNTMLGTVDYYRGYLGSGMLADHIDGVMNNWNRKHQEMVQQLTDLATATDAVINQFKQLDNTLGQSLTPGAGGLK